MRPTTPESLSCMKRVLVEVVMPVVTDRYVLEQIGHQLQALDDLARHVHDDIPRLMEANDEMRAIVREAGRLCGNEETLAMHLDRVEQSVSSPAPKYPDFADLQRRNGVLREALSRIIREWPRTPGLSIARAAIRDRIRAHLESDVARSA